MLRGVHIVCEEASLAQILIQIQIQVLTKLNLQSGYHQIQICPMDVGKNNLLHVPRPFEFLVLLSGLADAPSTFQALMNDILIIILVELFYCVLRTYLYPHQILVGAST